MNAEGTETFYKDKNKRRAGLFYEHQQYHVFQWNIAVYKALCTHPIVG